MWVGAFSLLVSHSCVDHSYNQTLSSIQCCLPLLGRGKIFTQADNSLMTTPPVMHNCIFFPDMCFSSKCSGKSQRETMCPRVATVAAKCYYLFCVPSDCFLDGGKTLRCPSCNVFHHSWVVKEGCICVEEGKWTSTLKT